MSAEGDKGTGKSNPGARQRLVFLFVAMAISGLGLLLGGPAVGYIAFLLFGSLFVLFFAGKLRRLALFLFLFLAVSLLVGGLVYARLSSEEMVARVGSWLLIGSLYRHKAVQFGLAALVGLIGGVLAVAGPLLSVILVSAEWFLALRETHELDRKLAMTLLLYLALGIGEPYFMVEDGKVVMTKPKGPLSLFGAPAVAVVKPYNAIVTERSGQVMRVEGPGVFALKKFERLKAIVDLRLQGENFDWRALTKDNVMLTGNAFISYRIEPWEDARKRGDRADIETKDLQGLISGPYPVHRRTLYRAVFGVRSDKDWKTQLIGLAVGNIAAAVRKYRIDEIFVVDEDERLALEKSTLIDIIAEARAAAIQTGLNFGVKVTGFNIVAIEMPEEAQQEFLRRWREPWRGWQVVREAVAKRLVAVTEAQGRHEVSRLEADAKKWEVVSEAIARLEAADHETATTLRKAQAESDAKRIEARAEAEREALFYEYLAKVLEKVLGREAGIEIVKVMARHRIDLDQFQNTLRLIGYVPWRTSISGVRQRGLGGMGEEETPEQTE